MIIGFLIVMKVGTFPTKLYFEYEAREKIATNKEKRELSSHEGAR